jgi:hypothetical protein
VISSGAVILLTGAVIWLARVVHAGRIERAALREELTVTVAELNGVRSELTSLSGLLPMCAWCKKIRDDGGYWQQLEAYLQSHTDVEFSHSMCPECTRHVDAEMPDAKWRI